MCPRSLCDSACACDVFPAQQIHFRSSPCLHLHAPYMHLSLEWSAMPKAVQRAWEIDPTAFPSAFCSCRKPPRVLQRLLFTLHSTFARCCCSFQLRACCQHAALFLLVSLSAFHMRLRPFYVFQLASIVDPSSHRLANQRQHATRAELGGDSYTRCIACTTARDHNDLR